MEPTLNFPKDFIWGAATSAYQIEGAVHADGRGESIWDRYTHTPGKISDGTNGDVACDHYNRWPEDVALMKQMGLQAYRFSIAWPRILPSGRGAVNQAGLDFYSRLIDGLLEAGIAPYPTLYHWDLPQALEDEGGWPSRDTAYAFAEYADVVTRHLGDRIQTWTTFNEPAVSSWVGYLVGRHAPGRTNVADAAAASHHLLLAHGLALPVIRNNAPQADVGITVDIIPFDPASASAADRHASWEKDALQNRWFLDPLAGRGFPNDGVAALGIEMDFVQSEDSAIISRPIDFIGVNYYRRNIIRAESATENLPQTEFYGDDFTEMDWEVRATSLIDALYQVHGYRLSDKIFVTENGAAYPDELTISETGERHVHDPKRVNYYKTHLAACSQALEMGVPLKGYFAWSLFDNFEWGHGYTKRFGIVRVDYDTQERTIKDSGKFYSDVIRSQTQG